MQCCLGFCVSLGSSVYCVCLRCSCWVALGAVFSRYLLYTVFALGAFYGSVVWCYVASGAELPWVQRCLGFFILFLP